MSRYEVIRLLELNGFYDAARVFIPTVPTRLIPNVKEKGLVRVDYAFVSPGVDVMELEVLNDDFFDIVSDHYPIVVEIDF
jgi:endonuclease/exonuclease/phosphatase family metal-dependent hydrolase